MTLPLALPGPPSNFGMLSGRAAYRHIVAADELRILIRIDDSRSE